MKKTLLALALLCSSSAAVVAQTDAAADSIAVLNERLAEANEQLTAAEQANAQLQRELNWQGIWKGGKYTSIFYGPSATVTENGLLKTKGAWNFGIFKGTSYLFPSRPLAGLVKVGFDVRWFDLSVVKYKKESTLDIDEPDEPWYGDIEIPFGDLGRYDIHVGAFGIGPVASVAPFSMFDNAARYIRATLYFHYQPTFGLNLASEDGDVETAMAFCNMMDFGGKIQYRRIAIGVEGRWGSGKYSSIVSSFDDDDEKSGKVKRKFSSTRLYISFTF